MSISELESGFLEADRFLQLRDYSSAVKLLLRIKKQYPNEPLVNFNLGVAYYKAGIIIKSIYSLEEAVRQGGDNSEIYNQLGLACDKNNDIPGARAYYKKALENDPFYYRTWNNMGVSYFLEEDFQSAKFYFEKALEINAMDPDTWFNLRDTYVELGMSKDAEIADQEYHSLMLH